jgi:hypothetical protein
VQNVGVDPDLDPAEIKKIDRHENRHDYGNTFFANLETLKSDLLLNEESSAIWVTRYSCSHESCAGRDLDALHRGKLGSVAGKLV